MITDDFIIWLFEQDPLEPIDHSDWQTCAVGKFAAGRFDRAAELRSEIVRKGGPMYHAIGDGHPVDDYEVKTGGAIETYGQLAVQCLHYLRNDKSYPIEITHLHFMEWLRGWADVAPDAQISHVSWEDCAVGEFLRFCKEPQIDHGEELGWPCEIQRALARPGLLGHLEEVSTPRGLWLKLIEIVGA